MAILLSKLPGKSFGVQESSKPKKVCKVNRSYTIHKDINLDPINLSTINQFI